MSNLHVDQGRAYIRYVSKDVISHPIFKSDLLVGLTILVYAVLFTLPKVPAAECFSRLFHSFICSWFVGKGVKKPSHGRSNGISVILRFV